MARKKSSGLAFFSPIDPSMHFVLFLIMALLLVFVVAAVMMQTGKNARALFVCPQVTQGAIADKVRSCPKPYTVKMVLDDNRCPVPECVLKPQ